MLSKKLDFKMLLLKQTINRIAPRILRLSSGVKAETPQSRLILRTWARLEAVLAKDELTGWFHDKNFRNLLESVKKALIFLCENDKYYKRWIGLLAFILSEELRNAESDFDYEEALNMTCRPLMLKLEEFEKHKRALFEFHMAGYLYAFSTTKPSISTEIVKAKELRSYIDVPTSDPQAVVRFFYPDERNMSFYMLLTDREASESENKIDMKVSKREMGERE